MKDHNTMMGVKTDPVWPINANSADLIALRADHM
jgi:hypothetical protein